jgi:RHS repeat-associated protein
MNLHFQFTGQQVDGTALVYLRARYYEPTQGRFLTRDAWEGDPNQPLSHNAWLYAHQNPIGHTDPSGHIAQGQDAEEAERILGRLLQVYQVRITQDWGWRTLPLGFHSGFEGAVQGYTCPRYWDPGNWSSSEELAIVSEAIHEISPGSMSVNRFRQLFGGTRITRTQLDWLFPTPLTPAPSLWSVLGEMVIPNSTFTGSPMYATYSIIHEFGHIWDYHTGHALAVGLMLELETWVCDDLGECRWWPYYARVDEDTLEVVLPETPPGTPLRCQGRAPSPTDPRSECRQPPYASTYGSRHMSGPGEEDWAESFATYVYPDWFRSLDRTILVSGGRREDYVREAIRGSH